MIGPAAGVVPASSMRPLVAEGPNQGAAVEDPERLTILALDEDRSEALARAGKLGDSAAAERQLLADAPGERIVLEAEIEARRDAHGRQICAAHADRPRLP